MTSPGSAPTAPSSSPSSPTADEGQRSGAERSPSAGRRGRVSTRRTAVPRAAREPAALDPVARLMVDVPLAHLDRPFDYLVPEALSADIVPGSRVRVRFSGRLVDAYVLERRAVSDHEGKLAFVERAVGGEPVLSAQTTALFRAVADRWAGNFVDVVRLGVPSRHAAAEASAHDRAPRPPPPERTGFERYRAGPAFLSAVANARAARAVWSALPGSPGRTGWPRRCQRRARGRTRCDRGGARRPRPCASRCGVDGCTRHGRSRGAVCRPGPAERYRRWLAVRRGEVRAVDRDASGRLCTRRRPRPARDLGRRRRSLRRAASAVRACPRRAGPARLAERRRAAGRRLRPHRRGPTAGRFRAGRHEIVADRASLRAAAPRVVATGDDAELARDPAAAAARLPSLAWRTTRDALAAGHPVLVQVPRARIRPVAGLCARPHSRALPGVLRAARDARRGGDRDLPLVRATGGGLGLPDLRRAADAGRRRRRRPHRRGAGPCLSRRRRCAPSGGERVLADVGAGAGPRRRHARGRTGRRRRLRGGVVARRLGVALARRPARGRGDAAALDERRGAGAHRRARSSSAPTPALPRCRRWCGGIRPDSQPGSWPSAANWASRPPPGWRRSPGARVAVDELLAARDAAARCRRSVGPVPGRSGCRRRRRADARSARAARPPRAGRRPRQSRRSRPTRSSCSTRRRLGPAAARIIALESLQTAHGPLRLTGCAPDSASSYAASSPGDGGRRERGAFAGQLPRRPSRGAVRRARRRARTARRASARRRPR